MTSLEKKLEKLQQISVGKTESDWAEYKKLWIASIKDLRDTIMYKWFHDYESKGLMKFAVVPTYRIEPFLLEYLTMNLEITFTNSKSIVLEPVAGITTDYDGRLDFYMRGNMNKSVTILRKLLPKNKYEWFIAKSHNNAEYLKLDKAQLEKLISEWLA